MRTVDIATFKQQAEKLFEDAVDGQPTIIEHDGKRAVLLQCHDGIPDSVLYPKLNALIEERIHHPAREATERDWQALRNRVIRRK